MNIEATSASIINPKLRCIHQQLTDLALRSLAAGIYAYGLRTEHLNCNNVAAVRRDQTMRYSTSTGGSSRKFQTSWPRHSYFFITQIQHECRYPSIIK